MKRELYSILTHLVIVLLFVSFQLKAQSFDLILRHGTVYDGSGKSPFVADIGIRGDSIAHIGDLTAARAKTELDVGGLAVAPGFINLLSWADGTLLRDGTAMSDIKQGVTLEVFGEGLSAGPRKRKPGDKKWGTLGEYFDFLQKKGVSPNFASFVGATTIRDYVIGQDNRNPTYEELIQMKELVRKAMEEGAMGVGSSLIYTPGTFASTEELIALCKAAAPFRGMYITHMRSESDKILEALNETFAISREAKVPAEIYHLKVLNQRNWSKIDAILLKIDSAQKAGLKITANMYPYAASATGLKERVPAWAQEGGMSKMRERFKIQHVRARILHEMANGIPIRNSDPTEVMLIGFRKDSLNNLYKGKRLDEVARQHGKDADETVLDLIDADRSSIPSIYFTISEDNLRRMISQPYVSIGSDAGALSLTKDFMDQGAHPRAYGTFARFLGKYVRDEKMMTMEEGIRRITSQPAERLQLKRRGLLKVGNSADVVVFDPARIKDNATFEQPHQYATGVLHVFVNGVQVLRDGEHTGALPGRSIRGPGYRSKSQAPNNK